MTTARLTHHARQRAAEMEIPTRIVKRAMELPGVDYPGRESGHTNGARVRIPHGLDFALVYVPGDPVMIVSVLEATQERYDRKQATRLGDQIEIGDER